MNATVQIHNSRSDIEVTTSRRAVVGATEVKRWQSTDASNDALVGGVLVDGAVSKTARLDGFDPHAPCRGQQRARFSA